MPSQLVLPPWAAVSRLWQPPWGHILTVGGCWGAWPRSIPACCGSGRGSPQQRWPLGMPLVGAPSPRVTFPLQDHHTGICLIGDRDQGWDLEGPEHQQKEDVPSTRPKLSLSPAAPGRGLATFASILVQLGPVQGEAGGRRADPHTCIATQREREAMQNASQPPGNSLRSKRPQEPLCSFECRRPPAPEYQRFLP